jgi:hypothetical protein
MQCAVKGACHCAQPLLRAATAPSCHSRAGLFSEPLRVGRCSRRTARNSSDAVLALPATSCAVRPCESGCPTRAPWPVVGGKAVRVRVRACHSRAGLRNEPLRVGRCSRRTALASSDRVPSLPATSAEAVCCQGCLPLAQPLLRAATARKSQPRRAPQPATPSESLLQAHRA